MKSDSMLSLGQLAALHPEWIPVLDRFALDYCCHGSRTLDEACQAAGVCVAEVQDALEHQSQTPDAPPERNWLLVGMTELADHIESAHHVLARQEFLRLATLVPRVVAAHAERHFWLLELQQVVQTLSDAMHDHMVREERVLFPWLRRLDQPSKIHTGPPWSVRRPISCMVHDHDEVAGGFARLRTLTSNYAPPQGVCGSFRSMLETMSRLESDTRVHIHKENNILFPAGVQAENEQLALASQRQGRDPPIGMPQCPSASSNGSGDAIH